MKGISKVKGKCKSLFKKQPEDAIVSEDDSVTEDSTGETAQGLAKKLKAETEVAEKDLYSPLVSVVLPESISAEDLIKNASGGLALEGIFKSDNLEDLWTKREQLLALPLHIELKEAAHPISDHCLRFETLEEEISWRKTVEKLGLSLSCSTQISLLGPINGQAEAKLKFEPKCQQLSRSDSASQNKFMGKYYYRPIKSFHFSQNQLCLTKSSIEMLQELEKANSQNISESACNYFKRFGTHANKGPLHFGGIFCQNVYSEALGTESKIENKDAVAVGTNLNINAGVSKFVFDKVVEADMNVSKKSSLALNDSNIMLSNTLGSAVTRIGGPAMANTPEKWQEGLHLSNANWALIDRGSDLVPVWEIIKQNHSSEFKDCQKLSELLKREYDLLVYPENI